MKRLLTLLLLLAPSVLAQNPTSGGPIPQTTYNTPSLIGGIPFSNQVNIACASSITLPFSVGFSITDFFINLNCNVSTSVITPASPPTGVEIVLTITQAAGGNTFAFPSVFVATSVPSISSAAGTSSVSTWQYCGTVGNGNACPANQWQNTDLGPTGISCAGCTTNIITKYNGSSLTSSSMTDDGTSVTSTDTGGFIAPVFVSNGTTAGFVDYPQGSTSVAVAPCNTATSICDQAPTAVTSYINTRPGSASSGIVLNSNAGGSPSLVAQSFSGDSNHAVHVTAQTATKTIYTLCPTTAGGCNVAGQYRVTWYFNQGGTACGTPTPGQVTFALSWTDNAGAHSAIALPMNDNSSIAVFTSAFKFAATNVTGFASGEFNLWSTGAQPIQVTNTYTPCGVGTGTWELTAAVEQVQ